MSKQCLDMQQMQHLQELGLDTSNASMYWLSYNGVSVAIPINFHLSTSDNDYVICNAYTLQDVLDALPKEIEIDNRKYSLIIEKDAVMYVNWIGEAQMGWILGKGKCINKFIPLIDYAYSMLVECIEQGYVETNKKQVIYGRERN